MTESILSGSTLTLLEIGEVAFVSVVGLARAGWGVVGGLTGVVGRTQQMWSWQRSVCGSSEVLINRSLLPTVSTTCVWGYNLLLVEGLLGGAHRGSY